MSFEGAGHMARQGFGSDAGPDNSDLKKLFGAALTLQP
jgi:hypothetical protein